MSETLTREQIEAWKREADYAHDDLLVKFFPDELSALCTMTLSSIAMREALKPFSYIGQHKIKPDWDDDDAPVPERILNEGVSIEDFRLAAKAYHAPLTSLPEPNAAEAYQEQGK